MRVRDGLGIEGGGRREPLGWTVSAAEMSRQYGSWTLEVVSCAMATG